MTYEEARSTIVAHLVTGIGSELPILKLVWDNTTKVDLNTIGDSFLQIDIDFEDQVQASLGGDVEEVIGTIGFRFFIKEGKGTVQTLRTFDSLSALCRQQFLSGLYMGTPKPGAKLDKAGWRSTVLHVPFHYHSLY